MSSEEEQLSEFELLRRKWRLEDDKKHILEQWQEVRD
jgi:hypothetical protein